MKHTPCMLRTLTDESSLEVLSWWQRLQTAKAKRARLAESCLDELYLRRKELDQLIEALSAIEGDGHAMARRSSVARRP